MIGKRMSRLLIPAMLLLPLAGLLPNAWGGSPWQNLLTSNRVEAEPGKTYALTEQNGPWMVMAYSFSGEGADKQAQDLVLELRKKYKLPAYTHRMKFEFGETTGRGTDQFGDAPKMKYRKGDRVEEIAVLVGDFPRLEDPAAQEALRTVKYLHPDCLRPDDAKKDTSTLASWRNIQRYVMAADDRRKQRGPMAQAFVTNNPLLPKDYYNPPGLDDFVYKMNQGVEHSLIKCPGRYTVQVAHFTGRVIIDQREITAIQKGGKPLESRLAEAADKAHRMTVALRERGYEAYEFHDRYASIVTIGSFASVGAPRTDGKTEINPKVHLIMKTFGAEPTSVAVPGMGAGAMQPKTIADQQGIIPFDIQPIPVEVPKRSVAASYAR